MAGMIMFIGSGMWTQGITGASTIYYEAPEIVEVVSEITDQELLREFLENQNAQSMLQYVNEIVKLPRYIEVVAIIGHETSFCTKGVGASRNNCGAIMNTKGEFKWYASKLDAIEDLSILLMNNWYKKKTIMQMNGIYCVLEGRECKDWTENIT